MPPEMPSSATPDESHDGRAADAQTLGWGDLFTMGLVTAVAIAAGLLLGLLVDHLAGTTPVFLFIGLVIGVVGAVAYIVSKFRTYLSSNTR